MYLWLPKTNKLLGFIRRNARYIRSTSTRRTLYLGLVHAHFAYATQVWAPQTIELISKLVKSQRRATKFILHLPFITEISYKERLISLDLLPVCYWHELLDMVFFYKTTHNLVHLSPSAAPIVRGSARLTRKSATTCIFPTESRIWYLLAEWTWPMLLLPVSNLFSVTTTLVQSEWTTIQTILDLLKPICWNVTP